MTRDKVSIEVLNSLIARKCYAISDAEQIAVMKAVTSLYGPVPDPETGLCKCGCGMPLKLCYFPGERGRYKSPGYWVEGTCHCYINIGMYRDEDGIDRGVFGTKEEAILSANTAMGWRG